MKISAFLGALLCSITVLAAPQGDTYTVLTNSRNRWHKDTSLFFPNSAGFTEATKRYTVFSKPNYVAAIRPGCESDVAKAVKLAGSLNLPFLATGGRHGTGRDFQNMKRGLAIDLSGLNKVEVNKEAATITVGGGTKFGDVYKPVEDAGFMMSTGSCSCPGVLGAGLGGGVGRYQGMFGLVIDDLISARLITAKGKIVEASATKNAELFWGLKGAGANFGIVIEATFKLHKAPNNGQILNVDFILPASANASYFDMLAKLDGTLPTELAILTYTMYDETSNGPVILTNWVYSGPEEEGMKIIQPLYDLNPVKAEKSVIPWSQLVPTSAFGADSWVWCKESDVPRTMIATNTKRLDATTMKNMFSKMAAFYQANPDARLTTIELEVFNSDAMKAVPADSTAYPWRDAIMYAMFEMSWTSKAGEKAAMALGNELRRDFAKTSGYNANQVYVNYAFGDETLEARYGKDKLPRLAQLKKKWDPSNVFKYSNPLPTKYP